MNIPQTRCVLASFNPHKLQETSQILKDTDVFSCAQICPTYTSVDENGDSFSSNSLLKALSLWQALAEDQLEYGVLADDSGLEVDALDGAPGVKSARYASDQATDDQNIDFLLRKLAVHVSCSGSHKDVLTARMQCALSYIAPHQPRLKQPQWIQVSGVVHGQICETKRKCDHSESFGYDPIFVPHLTHDLLRPLAQHVHPRYSSDQLVSRLQGQTYGQWPPGWKNFTSHRYQALQNLQAVLSESMTR